MLLLPGADDRLQEARRQAEPETPESGKDDGDSFGKTLTTVAKSGAIWYTVILVFSVFRGEQYAILDYLWFVGQFAVSYALLKRLSGPETVDRKAQWLARLWIGPTTLLLAGSVWSLLDGGLREIWLAPSSAISLIHLLIDFVALVFLLVSIPALWVLSRVPKPRPLYSQSVDRLTNRKRRAYREGSA